MVRPVSLSFACASARASAFFSVRLRLSAWVKTTSDELKEASEGARAPLSRSKGWKARARSARLRQRLGESDERARLGHCAGRGESLAFSSPVLVTPRLCLCTNSGREYPSPRDLGAWARVCIRLSTRHRLELAPSESPGRPSLVAAGPLPAKASSRLPESFLPSRPPEPPSRQGRGAPHGSAGSGPGPARPVAPGRGD